MSQTDQLIDNAKAYAQKFDKGDPRRERQAFSDLGSDIRDGIERIKASSFIPHTDSVRGFVYEVETGELHEVSRQPALRN
jgi:carbonic anhydrase